MRLHGKVAAPQADNLVVVYLGDVDTILLNLCRTYISVSEAPKVAAPPKKYQSYNPNYKTDEEKKEEVSTSTVNRCLLSCFRASEFQRSYLILSQTY